MAAHRLHFLDDWSTIRHMSLAHSPPRLARRPAAETRERLLEHGAELFNSQGYNTTGINAIVQAAGVPKGSFYHYFASKQDFGLAVIDRFDAHYRNKLGAALDAPHTPPLDRLRRYLESGMREMIDADFCSGCLIGNLGQELAGRAPAFRRRLEQVFSGWAARFTACLDEARQRGDITSAATNRELAEFLLSGWEGALMRAKVTHSTAPLQAFITVYFSQVLRHV